MGSAIGLEAASAHTIRGKAEAALRSVGGAASADGRLGRAVHTSAVGRGGVGRTGAAERELRSLLVMSRRGSSNTGRYAAFGISNCVRSSMSWVKSRISGNPGWSECASLYASTSTFNW